MARPRKHEQVLKRFSLRLPGELFKAIRHATVETDGSINDYILGTIENTSGNMTFPKQVSDQLDKRYPLRLPITVLEDANFKARIRGCSMNSWLVHALQRRVQKEGW